VLLFVDSDVAFRSPTCLDDLAATILAFDAVLVGEVRYMRDNPTRTSRRRSSRCAAMSPRVVTSSRGSTGVTPRSIFNGAS
jgi:hypothetical protein